MHLRDGIELGLLCRNQRGINCRIFFLVLLCVSVECPASTAHQHATGKAHTGVFSNLIRQVLAGIDVGLVCRVGRKLTAPLFNKLLRTFAQCGLAHSLRYGVLDTILGNLPRSTAHQRPLKRVSTWHNFVGND